MRHNPRPQEMYRHFKGNLYQIRCIAKHSETRELMVVYQAMYGTFEIFARPLAMFMEEVDREKYPEAKQRYRFELLQDIEDEEPFVSETIPAGNEPEEEQLNIDPLVLAFLDSLHSRITDDMINTMAVSSDLEIKEGDLEDRYLELRNCLRTFEKFECNRLR